MILGCEHFSGDSPHAAQHGLHRPAAFGVGKEDFAGTADFGAIVPALEQSQVALAEGCRLRTVRFSQFRQRRLHAGFERATSELGGSIAAGFGMSKHVF